MEDFFSRLSCDSKGKWLSSSESDDSCTLHSCDRPALTEDSPTQDILIANEEDDTQLSRDPSDEASHTQAQESHAIRTAESMISVFSRAFVPVAVPRPRVRRKMTAEEKLEYRQRRALRACPDCRKRRRKVCEVDALSMLYRQ